MNTLQLNRTLGKSLTEPQWEGLVTARDYFTFNLLDYYPKEAYFELYNAVGRPVRRARVFSGWNTVDVEELPTGMYHYVLREGRLRLGAGTVIKIE